MAPKQQNTTDGLRRRSFLTATASLMAMTSLSALSKNQDELLASGELSMAQFLAVVNPKARELIGDISAQGQDRYLLAMAQQAVRLQGVTEPKLRNTGRDQGNQIGFIPGGDPFVVLYWKLQPNATIRPHAHTYGNVLTLALAGEAVVENYEMVGRRDFKHPGTFKAQRTGRQILKPRQTSLVNLEHGYVHGFRAGPNGAAGLDITTRIKPKPQSTTPYLKLGTKPIDEHRDIFEASWAYD